jgi:hypothetical protein
MRLALQPHAQALYVLSAGDDPVAWGYAKDYAPMELARALARPAVVLTVGTPITNGHPGPAGRFRNRVIQTATLIVQIRNGASHCLHDRQLDPTGMTPGTFRILTFAEVCQRALDHEMVEIHGTR